MVELSIYKCGSKYWGYSNSMCYFLSEHFDKENNRKFRLFYDSFGNRIENCRSKSEYYRLLRLKVLW